MFHSVLRPVRRRSRQYAALSVDGPCTVAVKRLSMIWHGCSTRTSEAGSITMVGSVLLLSNLRAGASNDTWLDGLRESTSPCVGTNGDPGIGFCASRSANLGCSSIGLCFMDTAEQWEPDDARVSRPVLRERGGEIPPRHSPGHSYPRAQILALARDRQQW